MDIYVPKYKEIYIKDGEVRAADTKLRGEYNAVLRGPDGRIKYESGWQPNLILNYGLANVLSTILQYMHLGTSNTTPAESQTGIIGTWLGYVGSDSPQGGSNTGAPDYNRYYTTTFTFGVGVCTGTIAEGVVAFGTSSESDGRNKGFCRFLFTVPIVKGALDSLTVTYRLWLYTDITDHSGTINISGVDYDYTVRPYGVANNGEFWYLSQIADLLKFIKQGGGYGKLKARSNQPLFAITYDGYISGNMPDGTNFNTTTFSYGGSLPTYYATITNVAGIDNCNGSFNWLGMVSLYVFSGASHESGLQFSLVKTSDGSHFVKENTHELTLEYRTYVSRYVP